MSIKRAHVPQPDEMKGSAMSLPEVEAIKRVAKATWEEMLSSAKKQKPCFATQHERHGTGYQIEGAVAYYVRKVSRRHGNEPNEDLVDLVRKFLRHTGNVVVLGEVRPHEFRIFVSSTWKDVSAVVPVGNGSSTRQKDAIDRRADRLSPEEAGETRPPAPVKVVHKDSQQPLSEQQVSILKALNELGGNVVDERGYVVRLFAETAGLVSKGDSIASTTASLITLEDRGLVKRDLMPGKRTRGLSLTLAGARAANNAEDNLSATVVLERYLSQVGSVTAKPGKVTRTIADALGMSESRAGDALRSLEDAGKISRISKPGGLPYKVVWDAAHKRTAPPAPKPEPAPQKKEPVVADEKQTTEPNLQSVPDLLKAAMVAHARQMDLLAAEAEQARSAAVADTDCQTRLSLVKEVVTKIEQGHMTLFDGFQEIRAALA